MVKFLRPREACPTAEAPVFTHTHTHTRSAACHYIVFSEMQTRSVIPYVLEKEIKG